ncbi:heavy-metal-associated domain-containing protein [Lacibacter luteus]|uniref:heavy-metal-associated domain-containing protein n=1 Tax=Lacibacter luteus TaxID=2508719 RepID=UPI00197B440A|nr:heavy metal-associated domain-containing protein [Lacibacter luteus]
MKSINIIAAFIFLFAGISANAQSSSQGKTFTVKTAVFKVWGNCGMCKKTIEAAAKTAGATFASWDTESKMLTVKYSSKTTPEKIQKSIAGAGYDNEKYTAPEDVYNNLHECCKYDRKTTAAKEAGACCIKDGKCTGTMECCKKVAGKSDCCTNGTCAKEGGCCADMKCEKGADCCKKEGTAMADCCKDGKCSKHS